MYANEMTQLECLFCDYTNTESHTIVTENEVAYGRWDNFPASDGHAEIIPKRHVESYFDLQEGEVLALHSLAKAVRAKIDELYHPDGFTIGINEGRAAGRTIDHVHLHLIPRFLGDVPNPRGGIRHVIPGKGDY